MLQIINTTDFRNTSKQLNNITLRVRLFNLENRRINITYSVICGKIAYIVLVKYIAVRIPKYPDYK